MMQDKRNLYEYTIEGTEINLYRLFIHADSKEEADRYIANHDLDAMSDYDWRDGFGFEFDFDTVQYVGEINK